MHHDHLEKEGGTVSLTPSTETVRTKNEVVELPCSQRRLSVSTEPDDITFRTNGISGDSFSSDSKISSCSTVLSSVSRGLMFVKRGERAYIRSYRLHRRTQEARMYMI